MNHHEHDLEAQCCKYARSLRIVAFKIEKNGHKGIPDRAFLFKGGRTIYVEFKKPDKKGVISEEQQYYADFIGFNNHFFCDNYEDFQKHVETINCIVGNEFMYLKQIK